MDGSMKFQKKKYLGAVYMWQRGGIKTGRDGRVSAQ